MEVRGTEITIGSHIWVQYDGVKVQRQKNTLILTGQDDDSYLKVFNHFGRLLKLYTFEGGRWVDAETGMDALPFDETQAGELPHATVSQSAQAPAKNGAEPGGKPKPPAAAKPKSTPKAAAKASAKPTSAAKAAAKATAAAKPAVAPKPSGPSRKGGSTGTTPRPKRGSSK